MLIYVNMEKIKNKKEITNRELAKLFKMSYAKIIYILKGSQIPRHIKIINGRSVCFYDREKAIKTLQKVKQSQEEK
jgi:hypothetical protein